MPKKRWVEPKIEVKREEVLIDFRDFPINSISHLSDYWELFVTVTGDIPDAVIMSEAQHMWYTNKVLEYARKLGVEPKNIDWKGLKIYVR